MNLSFTTGLKYFFLFLLGILAIYLVFKDQNQQQIFSEIKNANYYWVALSAAMVLIAHFVRALRWQMLITALGKPVNLNATFYALMVGYLANLAFPRLGEVSRCGVLTKKVNLSFTQLFGTVITERLVDLLSLILVTLLTIALQYQLIFVFLKQLLNANKFNLNALVFVLISFFVLVAFIYWIIKKMNSHPLIIKVLTFLTDLKKGLSSILLLKNPWLFFGYTVLIWALYILSVYVAFFALQATSHLGIAAAFCVIVFGSLGMIAPVQGGIGAFHFMVTKALQFYSIDAASGLTLATLMHSSQTIIIIGVGFVSLFLILKKTRVTSSEPRAVK